MTLGHRIDDHWNVEGRPGFTRFTILEEKSPEEYTWSGERLTKKQTTSRPYHLWPTWKNMSDAAQRKEKQKWAIAKPKLDNARKLTCIDIYFIDPTDAELKETIQHVRKKLEVPMPASMPCKIKRC